jgi:hypothetical protein
MQVKTLINPSATIIRVAEIHPNDIYKRLEKPSYGDERLVYGKVIDVLATDEEAALVALEFVPVDYGSAISAQIRTFKGDTEIALFPATIEEYVMNLDAAITAQERTVEAAGRDYEAKQRMLYRLTDALEQEKRPIMVSLGNANPEDLPRIGQE